MIYHDIYIATCVPFSWFSPEWEPYVARLMVVILPIRAEVADPKNRICDAPGSWYCVGQKPNGFPMIFDGFPMVFLWFYQWTIWWGLVFLGLIQNRLWFRERKHMWDCTVHFLSLPVCKASTPLLLRSVEPSLPIPRISVILGFPRCWHRLQLSLAVPMSPMSC